MTGLDLRPLSLGEILDRTFTLYRNNFVLFLGIVGIPNVLVLAASLTQIATGSLSVNLLTPSSFTVSYVVFTLITLVVSLIAYLFAQGGSVLAVSEIYLGRPVSISQALGRVWGNLGFLFGVAVLTFLSILGATLLLVVPGIYVACRLTASVPAALIEQRGPRDSLSRSWHLTSGFAGRAFMIFVLYFAISLAAGAIFSIPFSIGVFTNLRDPTASHFWLALSQIGSTTASVLTEPVMLIATSIFYFDLRVRKEAFDLQLMLDPTGPVPSGPGSVPSIL